MIAPAKTAVAVIIPPIEAATDAVTATFSPKIVEFKPIPVFDLQLMILANM
jgi:hypothetical protein